MVSQTYSQLQPVAMTTLATSSSKSGGSTPPCFPRFRLTQLQSRLLEHDDQGCPHLLDRGGTVQEGVQREVSGGAIDAVVDDCGQVR